MIVVNRDRLEADLCRQSFYDFVLRFWDTVVNEPLVNNWHIEYLCQEHQELAERVFRREPKEYDLIINISPGTTKSTLFSVMAPAWHWTRDFFFQQICGSCSFPLALYLGAKARQLVQSDKFKKLFPEITLHRIDYGLIKLYQGGWRYATTTEASIIGMHGHLITIDDPIDPQAAVSEPSLKRANDWFDQTLMTRMVNRRITPIELIMQRLHQNDPTGHQLEKRKVTPIRHICLPADLRYPVRPRALRSKYIKDRNLKVFDPVRLPEEVLRKAEQGEMGRYAFAGQYGQQPVPLGGGMFKPDMIKVELTPGRIVKTVRYWDKAGTGGKGAWTVGTKMGLGFDKDFWILDVVRGQWEASERERIIKQTAIRDGKEVRIGVEQEGGSGGKESAQATVRNLAGWSVFVDRPKGDKIFRADPMATQINSGNFKIVKAEWNTSWLAEIGLFPFSRYKDQVDSASGGFAMLTRVRKIGDF